MIHLITMKFSQKPSWRASQMWDLIDYPLIQPHSWNLVGISNVIIDPLKGTVPSIDL